jgi:hypothetical protein
MEIEQENMKKTFWCLLNFQDENTYNMTHD